MSKMYRKGFTTIDVHPSQIANATTRGWSLDKKPAKLMKNKSQEK
jgi:hypothetical protein